MLLRLEEQPTFLTTTCERRFLPERADTDACFDLLEIIARHLRRAALKTLPAPCCPFALDALARNCARSAPARTFQVRLRAQRSLLPSSPTYLNFGGARHCLQFRHYPPILLSEGQGEFPRRAPALSTLLGQGHLRQGRAATSSHCASQPCPRRGHCYRATCLLPRFPTPP